MEASLEAASIEVHGVPQKKTEVLKTVESAVYVSNFHHFHGNFLLEVCSISMEDFPLLPWKLPCASVEVVEVVAASVEV